MNKISRFLQIVIHPTTKRLTAMDNQTAVWHLASNQRYLKTTNRRSWQLANNSSENYAPHEEKDQKNEP
jgi:hypothetical protein